MTQISAELVDDADLETLFDGSAAPAGPESGADPSGVVRVPVPTPQFPLKGAAAPDQPAGPRPKINIQIGGLPSTGLASSAAHAKPPVKVSIVRRCLGAVGATISATKGAAYRSCDLCLTVLHLPFGWVPTLVRNLLGGVAVVTCLTAGSAMLLGPMMFPRFDPNDFVPHIDVAARSARDAHGPDSDSDAGHGHDADHEESAHSAPDRHDDPPLHHDANPPRDAHSPDPPQDAPDSHGVAPHPHG